MTRDSQWSGGLGPPPPPSAFIFECETPTPDRQHTEANETAVARRVSPPRCMKVTRLRSRE
jgi:hypothetical protein